jgi:hypothetical protein
MLVCIPDSQSTGLQWQAFVRMEINIRVLYEAENFLIS